MTETAYLAHPDFVEELASELGEITLRHGRLLVAPGPPRDVAWAQNVWLTTQRAQIASIRAASDTLRAIQRNWVGYVNGEGGRSGLISERLPPVSGKPLVFGTPRPTAPLGSWTLLSKNEMLYSAACSSAFPNGEVKFVEDRETPPNRAYLKLWEALTLLDLRPGPGDVCLDLGASPGGWTWVLQQLGSRVISVDKAALDPRIASLEGVEFRQESAFGLEPAQVGPVNWVCCDVACYPARLLTLIQRWMQSGLAQHFVCTIKLQGPPDAAVLREFQAVPGSRTLHLWHNRHELTWFCSR